MPQVYQIKTVGGIDVVDYRFVTYDDLVHDFGVVGEWRDRPVDNWLKQACLGGAQ